MSRRPTTGGTKSILTPSSGSLSLEQEEIVPLATAAVTNATTTTAAAAATPLPSPLDVETETTGSTTTTSTAASSPSSGTAAILDSGSNHNPNNNNTAAAASRIITHWKESAFAAGFSESTWDAERVRNFSKQPRRPRHHTRRKSRGGGGGAGVSRQRDAGSSRGSSKSRRKAATRDGTTTTTAVVVEDASLETETTTSTNNSSISAEEELDDLVIPDTTGCLCCSALVCPLLGAQRIGNMAVLYSTTEWVEEMEDDVETGECLVRRRYTRPKLHVVVGPYWPMLVFVTYPLILSVSAYAYYVAFWPGTKPWYVTAVWMLLTGGLIVALGLTGCRDPGILYRQTAPPPQFENNWRWSDQAHTYRPRNAYFDEDTAVVVEEFDHTCPWTGTAIGKKNMLSFQFFVCLVFLCLIADIFLITGAL